MVTADTNVVIYATDRDASKASIAAEIITSLDFLSVQVLNEFAFASRRKRRRAWSDIAEDLDLLRASVGDIRPVSARSNRDALRLAERFQLQFFDALMIATALENGATTLYSEDMQHGLVIDGALTIANPFLPTAQG